MKLAVKCIGISMGLLSITAGLFMWHIASIPSILGGTFAILGGVHIDHDAQNAASVLTIAALLCAVSLIAILSAIGLTVAIILANQIVKESKQ